MPSMSQPEETDTLEARPPPESVGRERFHFLKLSIGYRLPVLIGSLLLGIIIASIWSSYRAVQETSLEDSGQRLRSLTQQLASRSQLATADVLTKTAIAAGDPAIVAFFQSPTAAARRNVLVILRQFTPP